MPTRAGYSRRRRENRTGFCLAGAGQSWRRISSRGTIPRALQIGCSLSCGGCQERPAFKWLCAGPWTLAVLPGRRFAACACVLGGPGSHPRDIACWLASPVTLERRADRRVVSRLPDTALGALRTTRLLVLLWLWTLVFCINEFFSDPQSWSVAQCSR